MMRDQKEIDKGIRLAAWLWLVFGIVVLIAGLLPIQFLINQFFSAKHSTNAYNSYYIAQVFWPSLAFGIISCGLGILAWFWPRSLLFKRGPWLSGETRLFLVSLWALFLEVFFIRYLSQQMMLIAYFKNMALIVTFMGLGIGCLFSDPSLELVPSHLPLLGTLLFFAYSPFGKLLSGLKVPSSSQEFIWASAPAQTILHYAAFYSLVSGLFILVAAAFVPLGQSIANEMNRLKPLKGYLLSLSN